MIKEILCKLKGGHWASVESCFCEGKMICPNCGKDWTEEYRKTHPNG